jgi:hypothetical protein
MERSQNDRYRLPICAEHLGYSLALARNLQCIYVQSKKKEAAMTQKNHKTGPSPTEDRRSRNLRDSRMMAHLLDALQSGKDIGHYGRLTFAIVARHFLPEEQLIELLARQPGQDETQSRALLLQVKDHDYSPPKRERILQWQAQQDFPICPDPEDPNACNVYKELRFPDGIYEHINEYWEEKVEAQEAAEPTAGR